MDFMKMLRSLEELLYEVMTWLVFYPRTFLRTLLQPYKTLEYCRKELHAPEDLQFDRALSPPLFLLLSLLLSHLAELGLHYDALARTKTPLSGLSQQNLVVFRALIFAVFPLMFALHHVKVSGLSLSRSTLRGPFFIECFPAAVFALLLQLGFTIMVASPQGRLPGGLLAAIATAWYLAVQTAWISRLSQRRWRAFGAALWQWLKAAALIVAVAIGIGYS